MQKILNYYDLDAWQQAHEYRLDIFRVSNEFPQKYQYSLGQQIQRAAISIGSNIAEGFGRQNIQEKIHFCRIARGSLFETRDQLFLAKDLEILAIDKYDGLDAQAIRVQQLLSGLIRSTEDRKSNSEFRVAHSAGGSNG